VPERAIAVDPSEFENEGGILTLLRRVFGRNPVDAFGIFVMLVGASTILVNALYRQPGPHPAPIFSIRPRPVATEPAPAATTPAVPRVPTSLLNAKPETNVRPRSEITSDVQRELSRRSLYDGPIDGVFGPKTDAAIRDFETSAKLKAAGEPTEDVLHAIQRTPVKAEAALKAQGHVDPIAALIAPPQRVTAVQRALNDYGYGPVKATGVFGTETITAIQKFERDRKLPVTGQISQRLLRDLAALTGRPLE
jgi:peptidoglycan hydrolase-like protein with peptidoglycan-binding domain